MQSQTPVLPERPKTTTSESEPMQTSGALTESANDLRTLSWAKDQADQAEKLRPGPILSDAEKLAEGFRRLARTTDNDAVRARLAIETERERAVRVAGAAWDIPSRYAGPMDLSRLPGDVRPQYERAVRDLRAATRAPGMFLIHGPRGSGKTRIACAALQEWRIAGGNGRYVDAVTLSGWKGAEDAEDYMYPQFLVIDGCEERSGTDFGLSTFVSLICRRYADNRTRTILVTNETPESFAKISPSLIDRIADGGGAIACDWRSLRGRIGK